jgi:hypothetical protein
MTEKQVEANRRNALQSTGPKTLEGTECCKFNALHHGLRALQTVVPGENADEWEAHRAAIVDDLGPVGAMETALAEQVAAKLWRLGRVVRYEADLIANAQAEDELFRGHELSHQRESTMPPKRTDIPTRQDVANARQAAKKASSKVTELTKALGQLQTLAAMGDDDVYDDWTLFNLLCDEFRPNKGAVEQLFKGDGVSFFSARRARQLIRICLKDECELDQLLEKLCAFWTNQVYQLESDAPNRQDEHESLARRYEEALERRRLASGLPDAKDLDRIQRYEAHLERGLHRDLDRLHDLQAARGAVPPRGPSVAVAVVQAGSEAGSEAAVGSKMGPFGGFHVEAAEMTEGPACQDAES